MEVRCKSCDELLADDAEQCPSCGGKAKRRRDRRERDRFWAIAMIVAALPVAAVFREYTTAVFFVFVGGAVLGHLKFSGDPTKKE